MKPDYAVLAKKAAGNWRHFDSFYCDMSDWEERGVEDDVCTTYTHNRDSGLLDQSNAFVIAEAMSPFIANDTAVKITHNHWAVGWVAGYEILVYQNGEITEAFKTYCDLQAAMENHPVLDEDDYSLREHEATHENISEALRSMDFEALPPSIVGDLHDWFGEHNQHAVENRDDQGGYPSDDELREALIALGYKESDE